MNATTVLPAHLSRLAVIYVRQSSPVQVEEHAESRRRQYQLAERAQGLGWPSGRCLVIDDDLGLSGAQSSNRPGYQRLISLVALREVGVVFGLEVSRLARNCLDWYQLLELAAAFAVLIGDEDGLYDPGDFNDRLLLGLNSLESECTACSTSASRRHRYSLQPGPPLRRRGSGRRIRRRPPARRDRHVDGRGPSRAGGTDSRRAGW